MPTKRLTYDQIVAREKEVEIDRICRESADQMINFNPEDAYTATANISYVFSRLFKTLVEKGTLSVEDIKKMSDES